MAPYNLIFMCVSNNYYGKKIMEEGANLGKFSKTRISGPYGPFILAPAEGWWVGLQPITWAFGLITIQSKDDLGRLQGRYPKNFLLIYQLEEYQKGGFKKGGTWRTLRVPHWRHG